MIGDCDLCLTKDLELILMRGCKHGCCNECFATYLKTNLKNISCYPRKCFYPECKTLINYTHAEYVLQNVDLLEYDRMLIMSSSNDTDTIVCYTIHCMLYCILY